MKTFDANDCYIEQRCTEAEIGTSWEPRWGVSDLREGACKPNMVGLPMPMQIDIDTPDADQLKDIPPEFVYEYELADYHRDRAAYRAKGGNVLALLANVLSCSLFLIPIPWLFNIGRPVRRRGGTVPRISQ